MKDNKWILIAHEEKDLAKALYFTNVQREEK